MVHWYGGRSLTTGCISQSARVTGLVKSGRRPAMAVRGMRGRSSSVGVEGANMVPVPVRSQEGEIPKTSTIFCIAVAPTALLPLEISVTIEELMPIFAAKSFLSFVLLSANKRSYACMNLLESMFFSFIIQKIELLMLNYL